MSTFILVLIVIVAILLVVVVLAQNPKGGGLASGFGGSSATQFMGVKKTGDFLESTTWVLAVLLLSLSLTANITAGTNINDDENSSPLIENSKTEKGDSETPPVDAPPADKSGDSANLKP